MSRHFVHDPGFHEALAKLDLDETSPELRALEIAIRHEVQRPVSRHATANGGDFLTRHVHCRGGGRLLVAYLDDGSTVTLLNVMRADG